MQRSRNVGTADRIVRTVAGLSLVVFALAGLFPGRSALVVGLIGGVMATTGMVAYCPLYGLLRLSGRGRGGGG